MLRSILHTAATLGEAGSWGERRGGGEGGRVKMRGDGKERKGNFEGGGEEI